MWSDLISADQQHLQSLSTYTMMPMQLMETQLRVYSMDYQLSRLNLSLLIHYGFVGEYLYHG